MSLTPSEQRFTFDSVAELYDRARPRYPEGLIDDLVSLSEIPAGARVLEIGCGTGQLTESLARRGFRMLCLEPGPNLARVARLRLARFPSVEIASQTFEEWPLEADEFALVVSAQAFHWIDPSIRFAKAAAALRAGGSLAVIGNAPVFRASPIRTALDVAYAAHAPGLVGGGVAAGWYGEEGPIQALFADSTPFGPVAWRRHPWSHLYPAAEYLDLMSTQSDHRLLPEARRESLLSAIREAIERHGGRFEVNYDAHLYLARRDR